MKKCLLPVANNLFIFLCSMAFLQSSVMKKWEIRNHVDLFVTGILKILINFLLLFVEKNSQLQTLFNNLSTVKLLTIDVKTISEESNLLR